MIRYGLMNRFGVGKTGFYPVTQDIDAEIDTPENALRKVELSE